MIISYEAALQDRRSGKETEALPAYSGDREVADLPPCLFARGGDVCIITVPPEVSHEVMEDAPGMC